jgi:diguanylate cyclase (GGDEF)-like protein/PAS domain S-box-containing protein
MKLFPRSLLNRVFLLYAGMLSVLVLGSLGLSLRGQLVREIDDANDTATMVIEVAAQAVADAAVVNDLDAIKRTLKIAINRTPFGSALYLEVDGNKLAANAPPRFSGAPQWLSQLVQERLPDVNRVIEVGDRDYGVLRLKFVVERVSDYLWRTLVNTLLFGAFALAAGLVITRFLLARWLSGLGNLQGFVARIQAGQLDAKASVSLKAPAEIRHTLEQFNLVATQFQNQFGQRIGALTHALVQQKKATDQAVVVIELDPAGTVIYANDLHARLSGWEHESFVGRREGWGLDIDTYRLHADRFPDDPTWKGEVTCRKKDGSTAWVRRAVVAIFNEQEIIEKYICLDIDISAEKIAELTLKQEKKRAEVTLHSIADGVITIDNKRLVNYANLAAGRILGQSARAMAGKLLENIMSIESAGRGHIGAAHNASSRIELPSGRTAVIEMSRAPLQDEQGSLSGEVLAFRDVTQEHRIRHELQRVSLAVTHAASGIMTTDRRGCIEYVNPRFSLMTGYSLEEIQGKTPGFLKSEKVSHETYAELWAAILNGNTWRGELINRCKDGAELWCGLTISVVLDENGEPMQFVSVMEDTTERKKAEDTIHRLAYFDALTQLPNRRMFMERAIQAIGYAGRNHLPLYTCYLDLDGFKNINDSLGHHVGDAILAAAASRIKECISESDFVGRIGGDEFALLLPFATGDSARIMARSIIERFDEPFYIDGHDIRINTSIGISVFPNDGMEISALLRKADMAMYRAKELGKRNIVVFTEAIEEGKLERAQLDLALRGALQRRELHVVYQPKVNLETGEIIGAEALMRWHHPEKGFISPAVFIPIAEESRIIIPLGRWIIEECCRQISEWASRGMHVKVAVNIAAVQFRSPDLAGDIERALQKHDVHPSCLELEVTESGLMQEPEDVARILLQLRNIGVTVAIDDFGTGYSSLAYLKTFPVSVLKIDRSFVSDLETDLNGKGIAEAIVSMAAVLGMHVVAEGVETAAQAEILRAMGCGLAQGYFFGRPMSNAAFEEAWAAQPGQASRTCSSTSLALAGIGVPGP